MFSQIVYAMGPAPGGAQGGQGNPIMAFLPLIIIFLIFYFLLIRPQQKKQKQHQEFLKSLKQGDEVITSGGIIGRIASLSENIVSLEVAPNVVIRVARSQIAGRPTAETK